MVTRARRAPPWPEIPSSRAGLTSTPASGSGWLVCGLLLLVGCALSTEALELEVACASTSSTESTELTVLARVQQGDGPPTEEARIAVEMGKESYAFSVPAGAEQNVATFQSSVPVGASLRGYWLDALMFGPALRHTEQPWPAVALELQTDLGLVGLSSRPPARRLNKQDALTKVRYHVNRLAQQPEVAWFGNTTLLRAEAVLRWRAREKAWGSGAGAGIETQLARASGPEPLTTWYVGVLGSYGRSWP